MQRRAIQLSGLLAVVFAAAVPVAHAEQGDASMTVGLRIVPAESRGADLNADGRDTPRRTPGTARVLSNGQVIAVGERVRVERVHDRAGRRVEVVTY